MLLSSVVINAAERPATPDFRYISKYLIFQLKFLISIIIIFLMKKSTYSVKLKV